MRLKGSDQRFYTIKQCPICSSGFYWACLLDHVNEPVSYEEIKDKLEYDYKEIKSND